MDSARGEFNFQGDFGRLLNVENRALRGCYNRIRRVQILLNGCYNRVRRVLAINAVSKNTLP
jgi:hypothetical protein